MDLFGICQTNPGMIGIVTGDGHGSAMRTRDFFAKPFNSHSHFATANWTILIEVELA